MSVPQTLWSLIVWLNGKFIASCGRVYDQVDCGQYQTLPGTRENRAMRKKYEFTISQGCLLNSRCLTVPFSVSCVSLWYVYQAEIKSQTVWVNYCLDVHLNFKRKYRLTSMKFLTVGTSWSTGELVLMIQKFDLVDWFCIHVIISFHTSNSFILEPFSIHMCELREDVWCSWLIL